MMRSDGRATRARRVAALILVAALAGATVAAVAPAAAWQGKQKDGGSVVWALEAETTNGFCIPSSQFAAAGIQVVAAIYDTLVTIDKKGEYVPYLAKAVTPNSTYDEWTIELREGVTFHDGTPLDAEAVKLNLDAARGAVPHINSPLGTFTYQDVDTITVTDPMTVVVTTKVPWVAFPAFLYGTGRFGIAAPAQLNDRENCSRNMIGTGPFKLVEWRPNDRLVVERNDDYWQEGLPHLDQITFRPVTEAAQRTNGLVAGEYDIIQTGSSLQILELQQKADAGEIKVTASDRGAETAYLMLNTSTPPFDDPIARQAVAYAGDAREVNEIRNKGLNTVATGPFPPDNPAFVPERPVEHDLKKAKQLVKEYEETTGQPLAFEYLTNPEPETLAIAQLVKEQQSKAGIEVSIRTVDQATIISEAIAGSFQGAGWRNHPGGDPDTQYVWFHSGFPTNFSRIDDPEIDRLLDEGRGEADPAERKKIYQELNRVFADDLFGLWSWYTYWAVGTQNDISGVGGAPLPGGEGKPFGLFAGVIPTTGLTQG